MTARKSFFRKALDAMIDARTREAERHIAHYRHLISVDAHDPDHR